MFVTNSKYSLDYLSLSDSYFISSCILLLIARLLWFDFSNTAKRNLSRDIIVARLIDGITVKLICLLVQACLFSKFGQSSNYL